MKDEKTPGREPYEPPQVRRVKLEADELAVAGCKSVSVGGSQVVCRRGNVIVNRTLGS